MPLVGGVTGVGVERGPATPAPEVGVGTNGSAVGVTGDVENTGSFILISYICLLLLLYCCIMNQVFIDLIATDASAAGTVQPGTVKCQYSACVRKSNVHTFTHVCFCSSCINHMGGKGSSISTYSIFCNCAVALGYCTAICHHVLTLHFFHPFLAHTCLYC